MDEKKPLHAKARKLLERVRKIALRLPEAVETEMFGHPTFRAGGKMFTLFGGGEDKCTICIKVGKQHQALFLEDERFFRTPYIGQHGWVSLILHPGKPDWEEVEELLRTSYRNNAPKKLAARI